MRTTSYYSNTYLGSSGEGSHAVNLSGFLLDLFPRSRALMGNHPRAARNNPCSLGAAFLL